MADAAAFLDPQFRYAVVGATTDHAKYGYRVLIDLHRAGLTVVGVNPKHVEVDGVRIYPTLADIPERPDVVVFVVPPKVGASLLDSVAALGIEKVWFQPGAEDEAIRAKIAALGLTGIADGSCIMVARRSLRVGSTLAPSS